MQIKILEPSEYEKWNEYVNQRKDTVLYHKIEYKKTIEETFKFKSIYFYAEKEHKIVGIAPFFFIKYSLIKISFLRCLPAANAAPIIADDFSIKQYLIEKVINYVRELDIDFIETREIEEQFNPLSEYFLFKIHIEEPFEKYLKRISKGIFRHLQKAAKAELELKISNDYKIFYTIYREISDRHGSPCLPIDFFIHLQKNFKHQVKIFTVYKKDQVIAADFCIEFNQELYSLVGGTKTKYLNQSADYFLIYNEILYCRENNIKILNLGRSYAKSKAIEFKKHWRPEVISLNYRKEFFKNKKYNNNYFSPNNNLYLSISKIWRIIPGVIKHNIGTRFIKYFI